MTVLVCMNAPAVTASRSPPTQLLVAIGAEERHGLEPRRGLGDPGVHGMGDADHALRHERLQPIHLGHRPGRRHEHGEELPGVRALAHDEVAQVALAGRPVVDAQVGLARPALERPPDVVPGRRGDVARLDRHQLVPAPRAVEAERRPLGAVRPGVLELVAVAVLLGRRHDRLELDLDPAEAPERVVDLRRLVPHLLGVVEVLPGAAAAHAEVRAARRHAARARLEHLDGASLGVAALELRDPGPHAVAGEGPRHEHDQLAVAGDAAPAEGEAVDGEVDLLTAVEGDGHG